MDKIDYSIIIPHHNIPHLLRRCLVSIPQRDDLQIIVVDDNSEEKYQTDLKRLEKDFPKVTFLYLHKGGGAGKARNLGIEQANGKYVLFADADDYFNYCINQILDEYINSKFDVIYFDANSVDTDTYTTTSRCKHLNKMIKTYETDSNKAVTDLKYVFGEPWCKMIKRDVINKNDIRFDEVIIHNDTTFSYLVGYYGKDVAVDKRALYCVTDRKASVSKLLSSDRLVARSMVFAKANLFFKSHNIRRFDLRAILPLIELKNMGCKSEYTLCYTNLLKNDMTKFQIQKIIICQDFEQRMKLILKRIIRCVLPNLLQERH